MFSRAFEDRVFPGSLEGLGCVGGGGGWGLGAGGVKLAETRHVVLPGRPNTIMHIITSDNYE